MLAFLTRTRRKETAMPETTKTETPEPQPHMRFLNQGGAEVHVTALGLSERTTSPGRSYGFIAYAWRCRGCDKTSDSFVCLNDGEARDEANDHATTCRAMPRPTA